MHQHRGEDEVMLPHRRDRVRPGSRGAHRACWLPLPRPGTGLDSAVANYNPGWTGLTCRNDICHFRLNP